VGDDGKEFKRRLFTQSQPAGWGEEDSRKEQEAASGDVGAQRYEATVAAMQNLRADLKSEEARARWTRMEFA
jgi:hypothetical protein